MLFIPALLVGVIAGLRAMTAPAAVSWAAFFGLLAAAREGRLEAAAQEVLEIGRKRAEGYKSSS